MTTIFYQAQELIQQAQKAGCMIFDGHRKTARELSVEGAARKMTAKLRKAILSAKEEDKASLLDTYDLLHRIGHGKPADSTFLSEQRETVYDSWCRGNRAILESQIYLLLTKEQKSDPRFKSSGKAVVLNRMRDNWIATLSKYDRFPDVTGYENYQRLAILMRENIDSYVADGGVGPERYRGLDSEEVKWGWYKANRMDDYSDMTTMMLQSYRSFNNSLFPAIADYEETCATDTAIAAELRHRQPQYT